ncbi:MAG: hypothetical protein PVJ44_07430 [Desulfobacterales bacterium]|jgi:hypothetical protein
MAARESCKLIDYPTCRCSKRLTAYLRRIRADQLRPQGKKAKNADPQLPPAYSDADFDYQLQVYENRARCKYFKIYKNLSLDKLPGGLEQMLDRQILPTLQRIGFEPFISRMLFEIAPSAWKLMGRADETIIPFQPRIAQEIKAVRKGLESKSDSSSDQFSPSVANCSGIIPGSIKHSRFPEHLFDMLDQIPTPWIILPRAFRFLEKDQYRYLPLYIKILDTEDHELCLTLFRRTTIEFIANFSFKFADRRYRKDQISRLLFYGYAALFWKTLRRPPENLENTAVFDHFFTWVSRFAHQNEWLGKAEHSLVDQMIMMKTYAFPAIHTQSYRNRQQPDSSRFLVTLRHGSLGTVATLRHFGIDQFLKSRRTGKRFTCLTFQKELLCLLYQIRTHYHSESKCTRANIRHFINRMNAACDIVQPDFNRSQQQFVTRLFNQMQKFVNS